MEKESGLFATMTSAPELPQWTSVAYMIALYGTRLQRVYFETL